MAIFHEIHYLGGSVEDCTYCDAIEGSNGAFWERLAVDQVSCGQSGSPERASKELRTH